MILYRLSDSTIAHMEYEKIRQKQKGREDI